MPLAELSFLKRTAKSIGDFTTVRGFVFVIFAAATHGCCRETAHSLAPTFYKTDNSKRFDLLTSRSLSLRPSRLSRGFLCPLFLRPKAFGIEMTTSLTFLGVPAD
jgi:hypothetical protein